MKQTTQIIPVPDDQEWVCLQCVMNLERDTRAAVLLVDKDDPEETIGMCGNHAEVMDLEDLEEARRQFDEEVGR